MKAAYYRGSAATNAGEEISLDQGMLAVGLGANEVCNYIANSEPPVAIACYNSPKSVTLSGTVSELERIRAHLNDDGHFVRMLWVADLKQPHCVKES